MANRTLLSIAEEACDMAGMPTPATIVGNNEKTARFILAGANQTIRDLRSRAANNGGWGAQQVAQTLTTVSGVATYDLPDDFQAMIESAVFIDGAPLWFHGPTDPYHWAAVESNAYVSATPYRWRVKFNKIFIQPTPSSVMTINFEYLTRALVQSTAAGAWDVAIWDQTVWDFATIADRFLSDTDQPRVPDYLVVLGIQHRLERRIGSPTAVETFAEYEAEAETAIAEDRGGPPRSRTFSEAKIGTEVVFGLGSNGGVVIT